MMREVPAATVSRPPHTAASRIATPTGRFHAQPKRRMVVDSVFCRMNTSSRIRITNPASDADHRGAARVNFPADSGVDGCVGGVVVTVGGSAGAGVASDGWSGDTDGSLVMAPSLPFPASNETTAALTVS